MFIFLKGGERVVCATPPGDTSTLSLPGDKEGLFVQAAAKVPLGLCL